MTLLLLKQHNNITCTIYYYKTGSITCFCISANFQSFP